MSDEFQELHDIAPKLNQLTADPDARVYFEWMSGGLVWSDELPPIKERVPGESQCLRGIWRYRSSLIMGNPAEKCRPWWEKAQELFPNWPGFLPERRSESWRHVFVEKEAKALADWEALDAKFEQQRAARADSPAAAS